MGSAFFDVNKYGSIAALSLLVVLIIFTNLRHCFAVKQKTYEGDGCSKLQYMNIESESHCPGVGTYAIAGQCLEYLECVKSTAENSTVEFLDYFQICEESQVFNGTGCSATTMNMNASTSESEAGSRDSNNGDCLQKHCRIVEVDMDDGSEQVVTVSESEDRTTVVSTSVDEEIEAKTETNAHTHTNSKLNTSSHLPASRNSSTASFGLSVHLHKHLRLCISSLISNSVLFIILGLISCQ